MTDKIEMEISDAKKILEALSWNLRIHKYRDEMNACSHLSNPIYSAITVNTEKAWLRLDRLIQNAEQQ